MPYRNQATVEAWVREYLAGHPAAESSISVLEKDYTPGPDSGLVVVALSNASTVTYIQPVVHDEGPRWVVTFEARADSFDLDAAGVARLSSDLAAVAGRPPVGVDVLAQQGDFAHALVGQVGDFHQDVIEGARDLGTPGVGHDAEAAVFAAAFHDGDKGRGPVDAGRGQGVEFFDFREGNVHLGLAGGATPVDQFRQAVQGLGTEHHIHIGRAAHDGLAFLAGHAAAHADHQIGILPFQVLHATQVGKDFFLGFFAYRTGVEQDDVGVVRGLGQFHALGGVQHVGHFLGVVFIHLAAEGADEQLFHAAGFGRLQQGGQGLILSSVGGRGGGRRGRDARAAQRGFLHGEGRDGFISRGRGLKPLIVL